MVINRIEENRVDSFSIILGNRYPIKVTNVSLCQTCNDTNSSFIANNRTVIEYLRSYSKWGIRKDKKDIRTSMVAAKFFPTRIRRYFSLDQINTAFVFLNAL